MAFTTADDTVKVHVGGWFCSNGADHMYIGSANRIQEIAQCCGHKSVNLTRTLHSSDFRCIEC
jgi:hypothetical protein